MMRRNLKNKTISKKRLIFSNLLLLVVVYLSDIYLQYMQNNRSLDLALKFALSWHTEKFLLGTLVLWLLALFLVALFGNFLVGGAVYLGSIFLLGVATYLKMKYRMEPIYPDDLKMITEFSLLKDMAGAPLFYGAIFLLLLLISLSVWALYRSFKLGKKTQVLRGIVFVVTSLALVYCSRFNSSGNLLKKAYDKTALWIPYSQKMNYYNVGFVGGFLFNLNVPAMTKPSDYSQKNMEEIFATYEKKAEEANQKAVSEEPNIVFVMSESFSDGTRLKGFNLSSDPLAPYKEVAKNTYSGEMLSPGYGGGTANIEFEALTGFSMELFNPQLTTPYTMLVPKETSFPSLVSLVKNMGYEATAIHPYNTSMYKRKDVYKILGFDQFKSESTMTHTDKLANNPYISDASAYEEVLDQLKTSDTPQFVHLVTMQTHMPYEGKYPTLDFTTDPENTSMESYYQDVHEASLALQNFLKELSTVNKRTLVVFWGDHLPSIYPDDIVKANTDAQMHLTEFLFYDSKNQLIKNAGRTTITSPFYFAPDLFQQANLKISPFYAFLQRLQQEIPAFEQGMYYTGSDFNKEFSYDEEAEKLYQTYQLIQYDATSGEKYGEKAKFYSVKE